LGSLPSRKKWAVAAVMMHKAVGKQLTCIFVDHGLLRKYEADQVEKVFREKFDINLIRVDAEARFLGKLAGVVDPERKVVITLNAFKKEMPKEVYLKKKRGLEDETVS
jgi:GMP synthase (glutamine-hydrolysing)